MSICVVGVKRGLGWGDKRAFGKGVGETSRRKTVNDWKGGEVKRVEEREASVAAHWLARRSKIANWWMSLWM